MNKQDLVNHVAKQTITKQEARRAVDAVLDAIRAALTRGERVTLSSFGPFFVKTRPPRRARNPKTGEPVDLPLRKAVRFKSSPDLKV